jgi:hypothetical protein
VPGNDDLPKSDVPSAAANMALKFGVVGSAFREQPEEFLHKSRLLGTAVERPKVASSCNSRLSNEL